MRAASAPAHKQAFGLATTTLALRTTCERLRKFRVQAVRRSLWWSKAAVGARGASTEVGARGDAHFYTDRARAFADLGLTPDSGT